LAERPTREARRVRVALEIEPQLSAAELARRTYGSFATAWNVRRAFAMLKMRPGKMPSV